MVLFNLLSESNTKYLTKLGVPLQFSLTLLVGLFFFSHHQRALICLTLASCASLSTLFINFDHNFLLVVSWFAGAFTPRFGGIRPILSQRLEAPATIIGLSGG
jgi:hypothetical protein